MKFNLQLVGKPTANVVLISPSTVAVDCIETGNELVFPILDICYCFDSAGWLCCPS